MGFTRLLPETERQKRNDVKTTKNAHKSKSWATLDQNTKNQIIGEALIDLGYVQA
jgi:hypothetical protein